MELPLIAYLIGNEDQSKLAGNSNCSDDTSKRRSERSGSLGVRVRSSASSSSMFFNSLLTISCFRLSTDSNCFWIRPSLAVVSDIWVNSLFLLFSMLRISTGETTRSHLRPAAIQPEHRSDSGPTRHWRPKRVQLLQGRMTASRSPLDSSRLRTDGLEDLWFLRGGIKDRWFLGTRNLEGGASIRTIGF